MANHISLNHNSDKSVTQKCGSMEIFDDEVFVFCCCRSVHTCHHHFVQEIICTSRSQCASRKESPVTMLFIYSESIKIAANLSCLILDIINASLFLSLSYLWVVTFFSTLWVYIHCIWSNICLPWSMSIRLASRWLGTSLHFHMKWN